MPFGDRVSAFQLSHPECINQEACHSNLKKLYQNFECLDADPNKQAQKKFKRFIFVLSSIQSQRPLAIKVLIQFS